MKEDYFSFMRKKLEIAQGIMRSAGINEDAGELKDYYFLGAEINYMAVTVGLCDKEFISSEIQWNEDCCFFLFFVKVTNESGSLFVAPNLQPELELNRRYLDFININENKTSKGNGLVYIPVSSSCLEASSVLESVLLGRDPDLIFKHKIFVIYAISTRRQEKEVKNYIAHLTHLILLLYPEFVIQIAKKVLASEGKEFMRTKLRVRQLLKTYLNVIDWLKANNNYSQKDVADMIRNVLGINEIGKLEYCKSGELNCPKYWETLISSVNEIRKCRYEIIDLKESYDSVFSSSYIT